MGVITAVIPTNGTHTDTSDNTVYTTPSAVTFIAGKLYIYKVVTTASSGNAGLPTISNTGTGLTLNLVTNGTCTTTLTTMRETWYRFVPTQDTTATFQSTFSTTQTGFMSEVVEFTNADARLNGWYGVRNVTPTAFGVANTSYSGTYSAPFASAQSGSFASFMMQLNEDITAGGGLVELSDIGVATPARRATSAFVGNPITTPSFSWTNTTSNGGILIGEIVANNFPKVMTMV